MLDELYMQSLADAMRVPAEPLPTGKVTVSGPQVEAEPKQPEMGAAIDMPQTSVRVGRAGITPEQSAKAGGLDRPLVALLDTLAGALKGATAQTLGLPGDIRSILDMINKEGAQKYLGDPVMPTTEQMQEKLPAVVPQGVANQADREFTAKMASEIGTFLPAPGVPEAAIQGVKAVGKAIKATKNMPVGMSTQMVGQGMDELGFYSAAKQAVDAIQQPKGTGQQFLKQIEKTPGVKPDEIKWTGLDEFLAGKKSVTKAEVQEYLDKNRVEIKELQLGGVKINDKSEYALPEVMKVINENQGSGPDGIRLALVNDYDAYQALTKKFPNLEDTDNWGDRVVEDIIGAGEGGTKFSKWQLPGGENYREIFMTLPPKLVSEDEARVILGAAPDAKLSEADIFYASRKKQDDYIVPRSHSSGMNEGDINRIAHLRLNDRVIDGKKTLFVEEVQSDWHQAGRKKGYKSGRTVSDIDKEMDAIVNELRSKPGVEYAPRQEDWDKYPELTARHDALSAERVNAPRSDAVPDAPFKTTWSDLAMKRVIQMASEGGYDRIAFTTGKTQAERYDLSKQVKMISAMPDKSGKYNIYIEGMDGDPVFRNTNGFGEYGQKIVTPEEFEELVGKDAAKTIMQKADELNRGKVSKEDLKFYDSKPADLTVGGEGMKGFYDDILPKFLDKYAKKWDAKTGVTDLVIEKAGSKYPPNIRTLEGGSVKRGSDKTVPVNYIDVTPKMRESVVTKGQPMFAIGAGGAGAAATQEENK